MKLSLSCLLCFALLVSCTESSVENIPNPTGPDPVVGKYTLDAQGGDSDSALGGRGGAVRVWKQGGTGPIELNRLQEVDANFTLPPISPDYGSNPYQVTVNTVVQVSAQDPGDGILYFKGTTVNINGNQQPPLVEELYVGGNANAITGLHILPGVRLTLPLNYTVVKLPDVNNPLRQVIRLASLRLLNDLYNQGTIDVVANTELTPTDLYIEANRFLSSTGSVVDNSATNPNQWGGKIELIAQTAIINQASLRADNGNDMGLLGGDIILQSEQIYNTGLISSSPGTRGDVGNVSLLGDSGVYNSGDIIAGVNFTTNPGDIYNSGNLNSQGVNNGQNILFRAQGGDIVNSGNINSSGQNGGQGGDINFIATPKSTISPIAAGNIKVSGNLISAGGSSNEPNVAGGQAGEINFIADVSGSGFFSQNLPLIIYPHDNIPTATQSISLLGYEFMNNSGGDGIQGGDSGILHIIDDGEVWQNGVFVDAIGGNIDVETHLYSNGGHASVIGRQGGDGGDVFIQADIDNVVAGQETVTISGDINMIGGNSVSVIQNGNQDAQLRVFASGTINTQGRIDISASPDIGEQGNGAHLNLQSQIQSYSDGVVVDESISLSAGDGALSGGNVVGGLKIYGASGINLNAGIGVFGGSANPQVANSLGGNGGPLLIGYEVNVPCTYLAGDLDVSGGIGATNGQNGTISANCQ